MDTGTGTINRADVGCTLDKLGAPPSVSADIDWTPAVDNGHDMVGPLFIFWRVDDQGNLHLSIYDKRRAEAAMVLRRRHRFALCSRRRDRTSLRLWRCASSLGCGEERRPACRFGMLISCAAR
jgi:hypothetical protein